MWGDILLSRAHAKVFRCLVKTIDKKTINKMPLDFKKLLTARFLFTFAVQMQAVILGWRIYNLLKDPLYLGLIGLAEAIPAIGLALYAGYLVDRLRPLAVYRRVIYFSLASGLVVLGEHLYANQLALGSQLGLLIPRLFSLARLALLLSPQSLLPFPVWCHELILKASAMSSSTMQVARIGGPALGGVIFGFYGPTPSSILVCLFLIAAISAMKLIKTDIPAPAVQQKNAHHRVSVGDELLSGIRFVFRHPILLPAMSHDLCPFRRSHGPPPYFCRRNSDGRPQKLGDFCAAPAMGAVLMGLFLTRSNRFRTGRWLFSAVFGYGISIIAFAASQNIYLSFIALAMSGAFDSISMVIRSALVQLSSPDHMRGKISAVNSSLRFFQTKLASSNEGSQPSCWERFPQSFWQLLLPLHSGHNCLSLTPTSSIGFGKNKATC